ncbi:hypothetical protein [Paenibacillus polymyxa]|uniref:hypothetical protein n=1 Tax=Paenibacillus polymyxa TaxID=1406 RepID=UPI00287F7EC5|nr:hypothetical protein [Paenibacillus polymyxa]
MDDVQLVHTYSRDATKPIFIGRLFSVSFAILALILCICFFPEVDGKMAGIVMAVSDEYVILKRLT